MHESQASIQPFLRDRLTWLAYIMLAYIGFTQSMLGPLMPFLRSELRLNYTLGGFLPATLAIGLILSGLIGDRIAHRWSRGVAFWSGAAGLAMSAAILAISRNFELALVAVLGMGLGSSLTQVMIQALLVDQHGDHRAIALTEANVAASLSATLTPLVIGSFQNAGLSWRLVPILVIVFLILVVTSFYRQSVPDSIAVPLASEGGKGRLSLSFWPYWIVLFLIVAAEMSLAVWATDFLANVAGLPRTKAALAFGVFPAAMLIGRFAGSRLAHRLSSLKLLIASLLVTLLGFLIFWLTRVSAFNVLGLFIAGLGVANSYPLTLSIAVGLAADQTNTASARVSLGVGTALLTAPLLMGWLADRLSLQNAYGIVIVFVTAAFVIIMNNRGLSEKR